MSEVILQQITRYKDTDVFQDGNNNTFFGPWVRPSWDSITDFTEYKVKEGDIGRWDILAYDFWGLSELYWVILDFNHIIDPYFGVTVGQKLRMPSRDTLVAFGII